MVKRSACLRNTVVGDAVLGSLKSRQLAQARDVILSPSSGRVKINMRLTNNLDFIHSGSLGRLTNWLGWEMALAVSDTMPRLVKFPELLLLRVNWRVALFAE